MTPFERPGKKMQRAMSSESSGVIGLIDTNVFVHALTQDPLQEECLSFLNALESGTIRARLNPLVVHELTYALPKYLKQITRNGIAEFVLSVLSWPGIVTDDDLIVQAVKAWVGMPHVGFVDAYLSVVARTDDVAVYTKNVNHLLALGAQVPNPLPIS